MKQLLTILILVSSFFIYSQDKITIKGLVLDSLSNKPIEFATISFNNANVISGTTSNKNGKFNFSVVPGVYTIKVEFLSYKPIIFNNKELNTDINLGTIIMVLSAEELKEVEIVAEKDLVEYAVNKKIYNAAKDISNYGGNAIDVLNNTPAVRVDSEGNAILRGATATILIDGKPLLGLDNGTDVLSAIPSSKIDKVEIISHSAKYSAEGSGGILNIITKKGRENSLSGSLEGHLGNPENNGVSTFVNESTDKINLYSTISFNNKKRIKRTKINQELIDNQNNIAGIFDEKRKDENQRNSFLFNIGSDFYLDNNNTLTTSLLVNTNNKNFISNLSLDDYDNAENLIRSALRDVGDFDDVSKIEGLLNYTSKFNDKGHQLSFDFKYDNTVSDTKANINENITFPTTKNINQKVAKDQNLDNFLIQLDYTLPLSENSTLELGHRSTFQFYKNDYLVNQFDESIKDFVSIGGYDGTVKYDEKIYAFYGEFSSTIDKLSFSIGLRTEISNIGIGNNSTNRISKKYTDLFPSGSVSYEFKNGDYLSVLYARTIDRPTVPQINPFISLIDERFQSVGNPDLNPYYGDYFEILYDKNFEKLSIASAFFVNKANNQFLSVIQNIGQTSEGLDIFERTFINSGNKNIIGADADITYRPFKWLRLNTYISPYQLDIKNTTNNLYDYKSTVWYARSIVLVSLDNGLRFQANYYHQSPITDGLTKLNTINYADATASKSILNKKAIIAFKVNDVFNSKWFNYQSNEAEAFTIRKVRYDRQFILSFTYRFNQKRKSTKDRTSETDKDELEDKQDEKL